MQEFSKNEKCKDITIHIGDRSENNLEEIEFSFLKEGITIIVGENNVGKTNLLDYIYYNNEYWDNFREEDIIWDKENNFYYRHLPLFFEEDYPVFSEDYKNVYAKLSKEQWDENYIYIIYYFDLFTTVKPLVRDKQEVKVSKKKIRSCKISIIKEEDKQKNLTTKTRIWRKAEETQEGSWEIDYGESRNFARYREKEEDEYGGYNPGMRKHHSIGNVGSGQLKYETLKSLIERIIRLKTESRTKFKKVVWKSILLIEEPEAFLHPFRIKRVASLIRNAIKKENLTIILTTHSPEFLSHFIYEEKTKLVITQKNYKRGKLKQPLCFWEIVDKTEQPIKERLKKYAEKSREIDSHVLYKNKWKRLLNNETLRIFFAKKVLFVEGPVEYNLFNNILREELNHEIEEKGIEVIPIFGKLHYAFFVELADKLGLEYWFLLDYDGKKNPQTGKTKWSTKSNGKISHENFWKEYGEGRDNEDDNCIIHSKETRISWVCSDIEEFLEITKGDWGAKQENLINNSEKIVSTLKKDPKKLNSLKRIVSFFEKEKE